MRHPLMTLPIALLFGLACVDAGDPAAPAGDPSLGASGPGVETATLSAPVFGLANGPGGALLAAETFAGITKIGDGQTELIRPLGGVTGVALVPGNGMFALTGEPLDPSFAANAQKLFHVFPGGMKPVADLYEFEMLVNPDQVWNTGAPESNPFNIAPLPGGQALIADAAGNDILKVDSRGRIDWVAVLTPQLASTAPFKALIGCDVDPSPPECGLPPQIPAQPVATSIALGPDGHFYAGELTGFPGTPGVSRVWRINGRSSHVLCPSEACTMVLSGLTSIMDLEFGPDGTLYVVELDADGWLAVEIKSGGFPLLPSAGGTVRACDVDAGTCAVHAGDLSLPTAISVSPGGAVWVAENETIPGVAHVRELP